MKGEPATTTHKFTLYVNPNPRLSSRKATGLTLVWDSGRVVSQFWKSVLALADTLITEATQIRSDPINRDPTVWVNVPKGYDNNQIGEAFSVLRRRGYAIMPTTLHGTPTSIYLTVPA